MPSQLAPFLQANDPAALVSFLELLFESGFGKTRDAAPIPHRCLRFEESQIEVATGSDQPASRAAIHVYVANAEPLYQRAIAGGAKSLREPTDQPYGDREASFEDPAGNHWYVATHLGAHHRPEGLHTITPYFHVASGAAFIADLERGFGGTVRESHASPDGAIRHAKVALGDSMLELSESAVDPHPTSPAVRWYVADAAAMHRRAVAAGMTPILQLGLRDRFGQRWYLQDDAANRE